MYRILPEQASDFADDVDWIHNWIADISVFFTIAIFGAAVYFAIRYWEGFRRGRPTPQIHGDHRLEILWTVVPTIIIIFVAVSGYLTFREMRDAPPDAMDVNVRAKMWDWTFEYKNGKKSFGELYVPVDKPVRLIMRSQKVLHSFFVPVMRVKQDVLPSAYTTLWFRPIRTGTFNIFCTEYCGKDHSKMLAKLHVVSQAEFDRWLSDDSDEFMKSRISPARRGQKLYTERNCNACHSLDGLRLVGPSFKDLWGKEEKLSDGTSVTVNENYVEESIVNPEAKIVEGYPVGQMPSYEGQLAEDDIAALIAFIRELDSILAEDSESSDMSQAAEEEDLSALSPEERGKALYQSKACIGCHTLDGGQAAGPTLKGLYGRSATFTDGTAYTADEAYLKESILNPQTRIVEGYQPLMPPMPLSNEEVGDLVAFIKSLK